jgi:UDP-glucose 4-epimerase
VSHPAFERILVTGGAGFIGRHVVERLVDEGHRPLITLSNDDNRTRSISALSDHTFLDLMDPAGIRDLVTSYRPTAVIHLAGTTGHDDPTGEICNRLNFEATVNIVDALKGSSLQRLLLIGSAAEYGSQPVPFREEMPSEPLSHYAMSKARANSYALAAAGLPVTVLRVFTAYGPGQRRKMFLSQLIEHAVGNLPFDMSDGRQKRDMVCISDVVDAILISLGTEAAIGRTINIGSGRGTPLRQIAEAVWKSCGADPVLLRIGMRQKAGDDAFDTEADISLAGELLQWRPTEQILNGTEPGDKLAELISELSREIDSEALPAH